MLSKQLLNIERTTPLGVQQQLGLSFESAHLPHPSNGLIVNILFISQLTVSNVFMFFKVFSVLFIYDPTFFPTNILGQIRSLYYLIFFF